MGFSRQEYWSGLPFPSPRDLPDPGIEPESPAWQADFFFFSPLSHPGWGAWYMSVSQSVDQSVQSLSHVQLFATPWTEACQASLSITSSWWTHVYCLSFFLGDGLDHCLQRSVRNLCSEFFRHSYLSYLIPWIYLSFPLYNHKGFVLGHTWMV